MYTHTRHLSNSCPGSHPEDRSSLVPCISATAVACILSKCCWLSETHAILEPPPLLLMLLFKRFAQLAAQSCRQWWWHCIAHLPVAVVDIATEEKVVWEALEQSRWPCQCAMAEQCKRCKRDISMGWCKAVGTAGLYAEPHTNESWHQAQIVGCGKKLHSQFLAWMLHSFWKLLISFAQNSQQRWLDQGVTCNAHFINCMWSEHAA